MRESGGGAHKFYGSRGLTTYPADKIYEEVAFIGYYMHWGCDEIMGMNHLERLRWCKEVSRINSRLNQEPENAFRL